MKAGKLWAEEKGVSVVLGALIIFASVLALYSSLQVSQVPLWNTSEEQTHLFDVYGDMRVLKGAIGSVAAIGAPRSSDIRMGTRFSNRLIFFNPRQGVAGNLTRENVPITVQYAMDTPGTPTYTESYTSTRLIYEVLGTVRSPRLVYEHGLIIQDWQTTSFTRDEQVLLVGDDMFIPWVTGEITIGSTMLRELVNIKPPTSDVTRRKILSATVTLGTNYPQVWQEILQGTSTARTTVSVAGNNVVIASTATRHIIFPTVAGGAQPATTRTIHSGLIKLSSMVLAEEPPVSTIDQYQTTDYAAIYNITLTPEGAGTAGRTHSTVTATVRNVTAPYDIHADLNDLTKNPTKYDMVPDYSSPGSIAASSWSMPNENTVKWTNYSHEDYDVGKAIAITFWVYNTTLRQQFYTTRVFIRKSDKTWF